MIDFKMEKGDTRGIYYHETQRILIYPLQHENVTDLLYTITHELIHLSLDKLDEDLDEDQEEKIIFYLQWSDEFL